MRQVGGMLYRRWELRGDGRRRLVGVNGKQVSKCWIISPSKQGQIK